MGKQMTFFLFVGMFEGLVAETQLFRKEEGAKGAFLDYTGYNWEAVTSDEQIHSFLDESNYKGSQVVELQIEA